MVVSNDQGYEPMLEHARELGFDAQRCGFRRVPTPPAVSAVPIAQKSATLPPPPPAPASSPAATLAVEATAKTNVKALAPRPPSAEAAQARTQATRADMQKLLAQLDGLPTARRPAQKDALLALLQSWLGESSAKSPRTSHALAQLQARKRVVVKGEVVSYPTVAVAPPAVNASAPKAAPSKAVASKPSPAKKTAGSKAPPQKPAVKKSVVSAPPKPSAPNAGKTAQSPTAAQVARSVLASLQKMTKNKPRQRSGLLKHIEAHAAKTEDPAAMAQRVLSLLEARKDVVIAADGKGITYSEKK